LRMVTKRPKGGGVWYDSTGKQGLKRGNIPVIRKGASAEKKKKKIKGKVAYGKKNAFELGRVARWGGGSPAGVLLGVEPKKQKGLSWGRACPGKGVLGNLQKGKGCQVGKGAKGPSLGTHFWA